MTVLHTSWIKRKAPSLESRGILLFLSILIAVPAFLIVHLLGPGLFLPAFSLLFFLDAGIAALMAHSIHAPRDSENITLWDIAGAFTLLGCAAAIFSEPDQVALFFKQLIEQHSDTPL